MSDSDGEEDALSTSAPGSVLTSTPLHRDILTKPTMFGSLQGFNMNLGGTDRMVTGQPWSQFDPDACCKKLSTLLKYLVGSLKKVPDVTPFRVTAEATQAHTRKLIQAVYNAWFKSGSLSEEQVNNFYDLVLHREHSLPFLFLAGGRPVSWFVKSTLYRVEWLQSIRLPIGGAYVSVRSIMPASKRADRDSREDLTIGWLDSCQPLCRVASALFDGSAVDHWITKKRIRHWEPRMDLFPSFEPMVTALIQFRCPVVWARATACNVHDGSACKKRNDKKVFETGGKIVPSAQRGRGEIDALHLRTQNVTMKLPTRKRSRYADTVSAITGPAKEEEDVKEYPASLVTPELIRGPGQ